MTISSNKYMQMLPIMALLAETLMLLEIRMINSTSTSVKKLKIRILWIFLVFPEKMKRRKMPRFHWERDLVNTILLWIKTWKRADTKINALTTSLKIHIWTAFKFLIKSQNSLLNTSLIKSIKYPKIYRILFKTALYQMTEIIWKTKKDYLSVKTPRLPYKIKQTTW